MKTVSLETIHEDLITLQKDIQLIKHIVAEDFELSDEAKIDLEEARKEMRKKFVSHDTVMKRFS